MFGEQAACMEYAGMNPGGGARRITNLLNSIGRAIQNAGPGATGPGSGGGAGNGSGSGGSGTYNVGAGQALTVPGAEIVFPMRNPYRPIVNTGSPVTGMNAYPRNALRNPRYYGFAGGPQPAQRGASVNGKFAPLGVYNVDPVSGDLVWTPDMPQTMPTIRTVFGQPAQPGSGSTLDEILRTIQVTLPATISAVKGQPYYNPAQSLLQQPGVGGAYTGVPGQAGASIGAQTGAALGNLGDTFSNIVAQHPFLIMGGGLALLLLFMSPPRRR